MKDSVIYHVGPVVKKHDDGTYSFVAAGPTTSAREEPFQADVIGQYGLRGVIGKGGMGPKTLAGLQEHGAVYLHAVGGTAQVLAGLHQEGRDSIPAQGVRRPRGALGDPRGGLPGRRHHGLPRRLAPRRGREGLEGAARPDARPVGVALRRGRDARPTEALSRCGAGGSRPHLVSPRRGRGRAGIDSGASIRLTRDTCARILCYRR